MLFQARTKIIKLKGINIKRISVLALACVSLGLAGAAVAQDDEAPSVFTYATYMVCDTGREAEFDAGWDEAAPVLDGLVEDGTIRSWGYLSHVIGGKWRRIRYNQADSLQGAFDGLDAMNAALDEALGPQNSDGASAPCPNHDDYIWERQASSDVSGGRADVGFSVYYVCDITREARADEIFDEHMAPGLNQMVADGAISSWGWQSHVIGGEYRRLQTMTAPDLESLLKARAAVIPMMYPENSAAAQEFAEICGPHTDYIWNVVHETP